MSAIEVKLLVKLHVDVPSSDRNSDVWGEVEIWLRKSITWVGVMPSIGHYLRLVGGTGQIAEISAMIWEQDGAGLTIIMNRHGDISEQLLKAGWHLDQP